MSRRRVDLRRGGRPGGIRRARSAAAAAALLSVLLAPAAGPAEEPGGFAAATASAVHVDAATGNLRVTASAAVDRSDPARMTLAYREGETLARLEGVAALTAYVYGLPAAPGTVGSRVEQDANLLGVVESYVRGATLLGKRYLPDGRIEVDLELNVNGLDAILGR